MKKVLLGLFFMLCFAGMASAQKRAKTTAKATPIEKAKIAAKTKPAESAAPLKKDGTADLRFKQNKLAKKDMGPLKKDGTPDMRYSKNKTKKG